MKFTYEILQQYPDDQAASIRYLPDSEICFPDEFIVTFPSELFDIESQTERAEAINKYILGQVPKAHWENQIRMYELAQEEKKFDLTGLDSVDTASNTEDASTFNLDDSVKTKRMWSNGVLAARNELKANKANMTSAELGKLLRDVFEKENLRLENIGAK
jgi:hypothetical protein